MEPSLPTATARMPCSNAAEEASNGVDGGEVFAEEVRCVSTQTVARRAGGARACRQEGRGETPEGKSVGRFEGRTAAVGVKAGIFESAGKAPLPKIIGEVGARK